MELGSGPHVAHIQARQYGVRQHLLRSHLLGVARRAVGHAARFGAQDWAHVAGLWHDLGKYRPGFQRYLRAATGTAAENAHIEGGAGRVSHSTAGALLACERFGPAGGSASLQWTAKATSVLSQDHENDPPATRYP